MNRETTPRQPGRESSAKRQTGRGLNKPHRTPSARAVWKLRRRRRFRGVDVVRLAAMQLVLDMTEQSNKPVSFDAQRMPKGDASAAQDSRTAQAPPESDGAPQVVRKATWKRRVL